MPPVVETSSAPPNDRRVPPFWLDEMRQRAKLDQFATIVLWQVYVAVNNGAFELAAMGIRAVWERLMIEQIGDRGSFAKNLEAFEQSGAITSKQRQALETVLDAGHAAIHRAFRPTEQDVFILLDVTEGLLQPLYDPSVVEELKGRIPLRGG